MSGESGYVKTRDTLIESGLMAGLLGLSTVLSLQLIQDYHLGFDIGNAQAPDIEKAFNEDPLLLSAKAIIAAPILEETIFRGLPLLLLLGQRKYGVVPLGIASTLAFGFVHNFHYTDGHLEFLQNSIPLPQLMMGTYLWKTASERGLRYSMLGHATVNSAALAAAFSGL